MATVVVTLVHKNTPTDFGSVGAFLVQMHSYLNWLIQAKAARHQVSDTPP